MKFTTTLLLFVSIATFAQSKTGTIDIDFVVQQMPIYPTIQAAIAEYAKTLEDDLKTKTVQYQTSLDQYQANKATMTQAQIVEKQQEITGLEQDIQNFQSNGIQLLQIKKDEVLRPIYQEIGGALEKVAKRQGYTLIMQTSDNMVYIDSTLDVTRAVLTQLGITIKQE